MSKIPHQAFKLEGNSLLRTLITPVIIVPELDFTNTRLMDIMKDPQRLGLQLNALWDTGANASCIKPEIAEKIGIHKNIISYTEVQGVNSQKQLKPIYKTGAFIGNYKEFDTLFS